MALSVCREQVRVREGTRVPVPEDGEGFIPV